jgi:hypothetical protein
MDGLFLLLAIGVVVLVAWQAQAEHLKKTLREQADKERRAAASPAEPPAPH